MILIGFWVEWVAEKSLLKTIGATGFALGDKEAEHFQLRQLMALTIMGLHFCGRPFLAQDRSWFTSPMRILAHLTLLLKIPPGVAPDASVDATSASVAQRQTGFQAVCVTGHNASLVIGDTYGMQWLPDSSAGQKNKEG